MGHTAGARVAGVGRAVERLEGRSGACGYDAHQTGPDGRVRIANLTLAGRGAPARRQGIRAGGCADHKVVFVTCDIISFRWTFTNRVADRVKARYGLPRENLVLFASHNHAGPTPVDPVSYRDDDGNRSRGKEFENNVAYMTDLENKIVDLVGEALGKMQPASLSYGIGRAHFALNRREPTANGIKLGKNPAGPTDESVPILQVCGRHW